MSLEKINVHEVITKDNPSLARLLPRFVTNIIAHLIHQDEINDFLQRHGDKRDLELVDAGLEHLNTTIDTHGLDALDSHGRDIFIANHPLGGVDGMALLHTIGHRFGEVRSISNDLILNIEAMSGVLVGVNRHGQHPREAVKILEATYASDTQIINFPAGLVSRLIDGEIQDLPWHGNFVKKAIRHDRMIVPVFVTGTNTRFFYHFAKWRKFLRIRPNLEMILLPKQMLHFRNRTLTLKFGTPIRAVTLKGQDLEQVVADIRAKVYAMREN